MSYSQRHQDERRRSSSPRRRASPPHDVQHGREGELRIRGLADSGSIHSGSEHARDEYRPNRRPQQDYHGRRGAGRDERDYYDDRFYDDDDRQARSHHEQRREYRDRDRDHKDYKTSWHDDERNRRYHRSRSPSRHAGPRHEQHRERMQGSSASGDWLCEMCGNNNPRGRRSCASCQASDSANSPPSSERDGQYAQHGANDVGGENDVTQILIFRVLETNVTEELLAKGAAKLLKLNEERQAGPGKIQSTSVAAHAGANPDSIKRVFLVRDRLTGTTWRYGFVEFATVKDAQAARAKCNSMGGQKKFTIASKSVQVDNAHGGVFIPVTKQPTEEEETKTFTSLTNPSLRMAYRSKYAYAHELRVADETEEDREMKDDAAPATSTQQEEAKPKTKKPKTTESGTQKVMQLPTNLQTWTARQKELHGEKPTEPIEPTVVSQVGPIPTVTAAEVTAFQQSFAYIGKEGNCCLLCMSKFPDEATLNRHERVDRKHRAKLASAEMIEKGKKALRKRGIDPDAQGLRAEQQDTPSEYRDRAKERRKAFQPVTQIGGQQRNAQAKGSVAQQFLDEPPSPPRETPSKAARMLAKQGWTEGQGLGRQLGGTTEAIAPGLYADGVGLGAQGGRLGDAVDEANLRTRNNAGEQAARLKEKAAERFRQLE